MDGADPLGFTHRVGPVGDAGQRGGKGGKDTGAHEELSRTAGGPPPDQVEGDGARPAADGNVGEDWVQWMAEPRPGEHRRHRMAMRQL